MSWKLEIPTAAKTARSTATNSPKTEEDKRLSLVFNTLNKQLQLLAEEAKWWQKRSGTKADLTRQVIAESIRYSKQELDTLHTIYNMPEG